MASRPSFSEEAIAISTVKESLEEAWLYFHTGKLAADADPSLPPPSVEQAHELLDVYYQLLQTVQEANSPHQQAFVIDTSIQIFSEGSGTEEDLSAGTGVLPVLANFSVHSMSYAPEVLNNGGSLQEAFAGLRCHALRCIKAIILLSATTEEHPGHRFGCASRCTAALIDLSLPEDLLVSVLPATALHESVRVAACEVLFAFAFRLPSACESLLVCQAVPRLLLRLKGEPSPTVRVFVCSILRLLVTEMPQEAIGDGLEPRDDIMQRDQRNGAGTVVAAFVDILLNDKEMDDIRVMATEILCSACKTKVGAKQLLVTDNSLLSDVLMLINFTISSPDAAPVVVEALARLVECMSIAASSLRVVAFYEIVTTMELEKPLSQNLRRPRSEVHVAAAAARAIRHLVQWSPPAYHAGSRIISNFATLSVILKTILECDKESIDTSADDADLHHQIISVELAITIALLLSQSPFARSHLNHELGQYPAWSQSLLDAVSKFLNSPTLDYYASIDIIDVTGTCISGVNMVKWSETGKPLKSSIRKLFEDQVLRVQNRQIGEGEIDHPSVQPSMFTNPSSAEAVKARAKLTFVLLNFAMALALDPSANGAPSSHAAEVNAVGDGLNYTNSLASPARGVNQSHVAATTPRGTSGRSFPSVGPKAGGLPIRPALSRQEKERMMYAYDKFDSAFKLVLRFAKHYEKKDRNEATYLPTADGYMVRQTQLKNPWAKIVKKKRALSWNVGDVKEGDLFYFAIPYEELNLRSVEALLGSLRKHMMHTKKSLVITPHGAKGRRALLYDLQESVLPQTQSLLLRLADLLDTKGDSTVRFPIFLFREREIHVGERALHSGILPDVMDQVEYYFNQSAAEQEAMHLRPELTADIDAKIAELKARQFTGTEDAVEGLDSDDDERVPGRGHGGISSDSD